MAKMHALHNIWRKNIKDSLLSKPYRRLWSPNFGHSMLYQLRLLFVLFRIKGVVQSVQGSETCIVDTSLLTMMWQNTNTEPVVCVNGCTGENLLSTKLRRRQRVTSQSCRVQKSLTRRQSTAICGGTQRTRSKLPKNGRDWEMKRKKEKCFCHDESPIV